jgi:hypothetical protein
MIDGSWLAAVLGETPDKVAAWRGQAGHLKHLLATAEAGGTVSDELLQSVEATCGSIYGEIDKCSEIVRKVGAASPEAASQLAPLEDTLRLVLLEITELSTQMYAIRSQLTQRQVGMISAG